MVPLDPELRVTPAVPEDELLERDADELLEVDEVELADPDEELVAVEPALEPLEARLVLEEAAEAL